MVQKVNKNHIEKYILENYDDELEDIDNYDEELEDIEHRGIIFEAFCEMVVELNSNYDIKSITKEYNNRDIDMDKFVQNKLNKVKHQSVDNLLTEAQLDKWIKYTKNGIHEYNYKYDNL